MNNQSNSPDRFEDRLLHELKQFVAMQPVPEADATTLNRTKPFHRPRYRVAMAGVTMVAVAGIAIAAGHDPASPAYAVESQPNGSITVEINSLSDATGLQNKLRGQGIPAIVHYLPAGKICEGKFTNGPRMGVGIKAGEPNGAGESGNSVRVESHVDRKSGLGPDEKILEKRGAPPRTPQGDLPPLGEIKVQHANGSTRFTVPVDSVPKGNTLVIDGNSGTGPSLLSVAVIKGEVGECKLVDAPALPAP